MDRRRLDNATAVNRPRLRWWSPAPLPAAVYRDLVAPLFTMRAPILGLGILFTLVSSLIVLRWPDPLILLLGASAAVLTAARMMVIRGYNKAGGISLPVDDLARWERRYTNLAFLFALLLAGLNIRVLTVHEPLMLTGTVSLVFTFGAGVVSRTSCRPRLCIGSLLIAVLPTAIGMLWHASYPHEQRAHAEFFMLFGLLLLAVLGMSLDSVRYLHAAMLEQIVTKHDLTKLARFDALTGLPNRLMLREAYHTRLYAAESTGTQLAIHYLDLDGFKAINDQFGHPTGDKMLQEVARRLLPTVRSGDVVFRLGGDEFVVIQAGITHRDQAELLARRIIRQLSATYVIDAVQMHISVSIGIALAAKFETDLDELIARADAALYRSKAGGKAQLQFCDELEPADDLQSGSHVDPRKGRAGPVC